MNNRTRSIDLNSDLGEGFGPWKMGDDATMLTLVTSANVACGGHASDPQTMFHTLSIAKKHAVVVGAHPGFPDLLGFGRRVLPYTSAETTRFCAAQIGALVGIAALANWPIRYVKPHGALNNLAADDRTLADAIVEAAAAFKGLALLAIAGTELENAARARGLEVYSEVFADRGYTSRGRLVPRSHSSAMITDPDVAADRLIEFFRTGAMPTIDGSPVTLSADSICIHGDSPHAVSMAHRLRTVLAEAGLTFAPFVSDSPIRS
jgi:5-oxoprolinase (ATP-hydrolysing) subunit A